MGRPDGVGGQEHSGVRRAGWPLRPPPPPQPSAPLWLVTLKGVLGDVIYAVVETFTWRAWQEWFWWWPGELFRRPERRAGTRPSPRRRR